MTRAFHDRFADALRAELPEGFEVTADQWSVRADFGTACLVSALPAVADRRAAVTDEAARAWVARASAELRRYLPHYTDEARVAGAALLAAIARGKAPKVFASKVEDELSWGYDGVAPAPHHHDFADGFCQAPDCDTHTQHNPANPILARFRRWVEGETLADPTWLDEWLTAMDDTAVESDAARVLDVLYAVPYRRREREAQEVHARRVLSRLLALSRAGLLN